MFYLVNEVISVICIFVAIFIILLNINKLMNEGLINITFIVINYIINNNLIIFNYFIYFYNNGKIKFDIIPLKTTIVVNKDIYIFFN